jgi:hypothetical protein
MLTKSSFVRHLGAVDYVFAMKLLRLNTGAFMLLPATLVLGKELLEISSTTNHQQVENGLD